MPNCAYWQFSFPHKVRIVSPPLLVTFNKVRLNDPDLVVLMLMGFKIGNYA